MEEITWESAHSLTVGYMLADGGNCSALSLRSVIVKVGAINKLSTILLAQPKCSALDVGNCDLMDEGSAAFIEFLTNPHCKIRHIRLDTNEVTDAGLVNIKIMLDNNFHLESLDLSKNKLTKTSGKLLAKGIYNNVMLKWLNVSNNEKLGDTGGKNIFAALHNNRVLKVLLMNKCGLKSQTFTKAAQLLQSPDSSLSTLSLAQNELDDIVAVGIAQSLKLNKNLRNLNLSVSGKLGHFGAASILDALKCNSTFISLALSGNKVGNDRAAEISASLQANVSLQVLKLANVGLGDIGGATIVDAVATIDTMRSLDISYNECEIATCKKLAALLGSKLCKLEYLDVSNNHIYDLGARNIMKGLEANSSLQSLNLSSSRIATSGGISIAESLSNNTSLKILDLTDNQIAGQALVAFSTLLDHNKTLEEVKLSTRFSSVIEKKLEQNLKEKQEIAKNAVLNAIAYLDTVQWKRARIMIVGEEGAGKTSFLRNILGESSLEGQSEADVKVRIKTLPSVIARTKINTVTWKLDRNSSGLDEIFLRAGANQIENGIDENVVSEIKKQRSNIFSLKATSSSNTKLCQSTNHNKVKKIEDQKQKYKISNFKAFQQRESEGKKQQFSSDSSIDFNSVFKNIKLSKLDMYEAPDEDHCSIKKKHELRFSNVKYLVGNEDLDKRISANRLVKQVFNGTASNNESLKVMIWDFPGDSNYEILHHLFINKVGVFLLMFNTFKAYKEIITLEKKKKNDPDYTAALDSFENILWWLNVIKLHSRNSKVILVGTHSGMLKPGKQFKSINSVLKRLKIIKTGNANLVSNKNENLLFFPVENDNALKTLIRKPGFTKYSLENLTLAVYAAVRNLKTVKRQVPVRWIKCLDTIFNKESSHYVTYEEFQALARSSGVRDKTEIQDMLKLFDQLGAIFSFSTSRTLLRLITINPQWLLNNLSLIMTLYNNHSIQDHKSYKEQAVNFLEEVEHAGLKPDYELFRTLSILSKQLAIYLYGIQASEFMLDFLERAYIITRWTFITKNEGCTNVNHKGEQLKKIFDETIDDRIHSKEYFMLPAGPLAFEDEAIPWLEGSTAIRIDFSGTFLPLSVFYRLCTFAVAYVSYQKKDIKLLKPKLGRESCRLNFGKGMDVVYRYVSREDAIDIEVAPNNVNSARCLLLTFSFIHKINRDIMSNSLVWDIRFRPRDSLCFINIEEASKDEMFKEFFFLKNPYKKLKFEVEHYEVINNDYYMFLEFV